VSSRKIVNFELVRDSDQEIPLDETTLLKKLEAIPAALAQEYALTLGFHIEEWHLLKNVIHAVGHPATLQSLSEVLPESLYGRLEKVALYLSSKDSLDKVDEIVSATLGVIVPTGKSRSLALDVIKAINGLNVDPSSKAKELLSLAQKLQLLGHAMILLNKGPEFEKLVLDELSRIAETDLNDIALIAKNLN